MKKTFLLLALACLLPACSKTDKDKPVPGTDPEESAAFFAKGADISWVTEMESRGYKFYNAAGQERECTALLQEIGLNAVRYRVWVDPQGGWNGQADVVAKAKRAQALGMKVLIDFHYSDTWADPEHQTVPSAWKSHDPSQLAAAVGQHTKAVLQALKDAGVDVTWVQIGNEVTGGMLWESGKVSGSDTRNFPAYFKAGADAAKAVYPDVKTILHIDNAWKGATLTWFFDLMRSSRVEYDIIGLSLYPSYWEGSSYPDWGTKTRQAVTNFQTLNKTYAKPVMLVEFGMPASQPAQAGAALQYIMDQTAGQDWFLGIFYWEPEAEHDRNNYDYGAFSGGKPTAALDPFAKS